jgi:hypothetical protein
MDLKFLMHNIFTTHTFGGTKHWKDGHSAPYKRILFNEKHLYSNEFRLRNNLLEPGEPQRSMLKAREVNLDNYVFAYLGHHEHYYAAYEGTNLPPFGIFIPQQLDHLDSTKVTKFDFASPLSNAENEFANFYSTPFDAREDSIDRIKKDFNGNFFHYWICPDYETNGCFSSEAWKWKIEFHYHEKVSIFDIAAILWPIIYIAKEDPAHPGTVIFKPDPDIERYREEFQNDKRCKRIKVYPFVWEVETSMERFCHASYLITKYFHDHHALPEELSFSSAFEEKYPTQL